MAEIEYLGPLEDEKASGVEYLGPLQRSSDKLSWKDVPGEVVSNIGSSAVNYVKDLVTPLIHPLETVGNIEDIAMGGIKKIVPGMSVNEGSEQKFEAISDFFKNRYGSEEGFRQAIAKDPVGVLADFSALITGGGGVVGKAGTLSGSAKIARAGKIVGNIGKAAEPLTLATKAASVPAKLTGNVAAGTVGFTTGAGKASILKAFEGGKELTDAMRGKVSGEDILGTAKGALQSIKDDRAATYLPRLNDLSQNVTQLDMIPITDTLGKLEKSFNIKRNVNPQTGAVSLDFSRSTINKSAVADVKDIISLVEDWVSDPAYQTPSGLDILKRKLGDFYSDSKNSRALVTSLKNKVKETIIGKVPEYAKMVKDYEKSSDFIDEITRTLSVGDKATADTGIRKLMTTLKDNYDFRKELIGKVDEAAGSNLQSQIAGYNLSGLTPQGFMGKTFDVGILYSAIAMADPKIASALAFASPRVVGEFVNAFGKMYQAQKKAQTIVTPSVRQGAFQAGRMLNTPAMTE